MQRLLKLSHAEDNITKIENILDTNISKELQKLTNNQPGSIDQQMVLNRYRDKMTAMLHEELSWDKYEPIILKIYEETFTQEEIDGMIAFYKTRAGQAVVNKMPIVMQKTLSEIQVYVAPLMKRANKLAMETARELKEQKESEKSVGDPLALSNAALSRGDSRLEQHKYDEAIAEYNDAISLNSKNEIIYINRGKAWGRLGEYDRAISDYNQALALNPQNPEPYFYRGFAYLSKEDYDHAVADDKQYLLKNPNDSATYFHLGIAAYVTGNFNQAIDNYNEAIRLKPAYSYYSIWRYFAQIRAGNAELAKKDLKRSLSELSKTEWPAPILGMLTGNINPSDLLSAADNPDLFTHQSQKCEAEYYLGVFHSVNNRPKDARKMLEAALLDCPKDFIERAGVVAELNWLPN